MDTTNDKTELHHIHDLLVDSRKGYAEAAVRVEDDRVKGLLMAFSGERVGMESAVDELLREQDPGAEHNAGGTLKGDLHRAWMDLRDALSSKNNANVLAECERGEGFLLMRYDEVLEHSDLLPATRALATKQRNQVQGNLARIKELRARFEKIES